MNLIINLLNIKEMEVTEAKLKIKELRKLFIRQARFGLWEYNGDKENPRYSNEFFRIQYYKNWNIGVCVKKSTSTNYFNGDYLEYSSSDVINWLPFFIYRQYIYKNAKRFKKNKNMIQIANTTEKLFANNKELRRDERINNVLNN